MEADALKNEIEDMVADMLLNDGKDGNMQKSSKGSKNSKKDKKNDSKKSDQSAKKKLTK